MKELKVGEVFLFLGTQYIVCGYNSVGFIIDSLDIWPFNGDPNEIKQVNDALDARAVAHGEG